MTAPTPAQTQREHDADDLVTEEMVEAALEAEDALCAHGRRVSVEDCMRAALRAVAPMIAARAAEYTDICGRYRTAVIAAEREACAKMLDHAAARYMASGNTDIAADCRFIAAAIRARGETP
jgi:hypothetical protein